MRFSGLVCRACLVGMPCVFGSAVRLLRGAEMMPLFSWQNLASNAGTCRSHVAGAKVVCPSPRMAAWALPELPSRELDSGHGLEAEQQVAG